MDILFPNAASDSPQKCITLDVGHLLGPSSLFRLRSVARQTKVLLARFIEASKLPEFLRSEGPIFSALKANPHPHLPRLITCIDHVAGASKDVDGGKPKDGSVLIFPEYHSDLHSVVRLNVKLNEDVARHYFRQLMSAVSHAHARKIVLRDIRLGKIMFTDASLKSVVFADLSNACLHPPAGGSFGCRAMAPAYCAPEVLSHPHLECSNGFALDMWSMGVVLFVLLTGVYPFSSLDASSLYAAIVSGRYNMPAKVSPAAVRLVTRLLSLDPAHRLTAAEVMHDAWLCGAPAAAKRICPSSEKIEVDDCGPDDQVVPDHAVPTGAAGAGAAAAAQDSSERAAKRGRSEQ